MDPVNFFTAFTLGTSGVAACIAIVVALWAANVRNTRQRH